MNVETPLVTACPSCGTRLRGPVACPGCGRPWTSIREEVDEEDAVYVWRGSYSELRRDGEPHRGRWIGLIGACSVVLAALAIPLCGVPGLVGLPLGIVAWVMASRDLARMRAGLMDPEGWSATRAGRESGIVGITLSALVMAAYLGLFLLLRM